MDFNREWTIFAVDAEHEHFGMSRLVRAHNKLRNENKLLQKALCKPCNFVTPCDNCEACKATREALEGTTP